MDHHQIAILKSANYRRTVSPQLSGPTKARPWKRLPGLIFQVCNIFLACPQALHQQCRLQDELSHNRQSLPQGHRHLPLSCHQVPLQLARSNLRCPRKGHTLPTCRLIDNSQVQALLVRLPRHGLKQYGGTAWEVLYSALKDNKLS